MKSKSKKLGKLVIPKYTKDKELSMLPIDLAGGNILPDEFKKYLPLVKKMIKEAPTKEGIAYLTIHEKLVEPDTTHRRGGPHIDGNFIPVSDGDNDWSRGSRRVDWKITESGNKLTPLEHSRSYNSITGGMLIASNYSLCKGWNGNFAGNVLAGGNCTNMKNQISKKKGFMLKPNTLYLTNSQFIHESISTNIPIKRVFVRITLPEKTII